MGILSGDSQQQPMHYGEVYGIWTYLMGAQGHISGYQTFMNHCGDEELRRLLDDMVQTMKQETKEVEELLKVNGVGLPPAPPERADATMENIPVGARFNDPEIAATVAKNISMGLVACSTIMGQSIREDIGMMFGQFHMKRAQFGQELLRMQKEKGWLITPPLHTDVPEHTSV